MDEVELKLNDRGKGSFFIASGNERIGEMAIGISGSNLTVYHTEVDPAHKGKGYAKMMLEVMLAYARTNNLKVIPLCPYVHAQFRKHPEEVADVWNKQ